MSQRLDKIVSQANMLEAYHQVRANKVSGWGDHYQLVAQKSGLKRAISKEVLAKQGLISCLEYYLGRYAVKVS